MIAGAGVLPLACCAACPGVPGPGPGSGGLRRVGCEPVPGLVRPLRRVGPGCFHRIEPGAHGGSLWQVEAEVAPAVPGGAGGRTVIRSRGRCGAAFAMGRRPAGRRRAAGRVPWRRWTAMRNSRRRRHMAGQREARRSGRRRLSTIAWSRCWPSAWISSKGESVNTACTARHGISSWPWAAFSLRSRTRRTISRAVRPGPSSTRTRCTRFGDLGVGDQKASCSSHMACGYWMRPGLFGDPGDRGPDAGVHRNGDGKCAPSRRTASAAAL